ncbi:MAG: hypothetical protein JWM68_4396 [Verrucomicrobiales bacterium]|nr:hypothetical protein [Verrucomicrobiales bacterium]
MKKDTTTNSFVGIALAIFSILVGLASALLLTTGGMFDFSLTQSFGISVVCAVVPAATSRFLKTSWWIPAAIYSLPLAVPLFLGLLSNDWRRIPAALVCVLVAFAGARLLHPKENLSSEI